MTDSPEERLRRAGADIIRMEPSQPPYQNGHDPDGPAPRPESLDFLDLPAQEGRELPARRWLVEGMVPLGQVTMISGAGGLGKSLLSMQLSTACATGRPFLDKTALRCPVVAVHCEDSDDELKLRQADINAHFGLSWRELGDLHAISREGRDNLLQSVDKYGKLQGPTQFYRLLRKKIMGWGAKLLILDSLYDIFGGNENSRPEVRKFAILVKQLALDMDGAVVVLAHPSVGGLTDGSGRSGSTAWDASVRSRLYLTRAEVEDDRDMRELRSMKANYSGLDRPTRLKWDKGVFLVQGGGGGWKSPIALAESDHEILRGLRHLVKTDTRVSSSYFGPFQFGTLLHKAGYCMRETASEIHRACDRLIEKGDIVAVEVGPPSKRRRLLRTPDTRYLSEEIEPDLGV